MVREGEVQSGVLTNDMVLCTASRTASRFGYCQPFSDPWGPVGMGEKLNEYGIYWVFGLAVDGLRISCSTN